MTQIRRLHELLKRLGQSPVFTAVGIGIDVALVGVLYIFHFDLPFTWGAVAAAAFFGLVVGLLCGVVHHIGRKLLQPAPGLAEGLMSWALAVLALVIGSHASNSMDVWASAMIAVPLAGAIGSYVVAPAVVAFSDWVTRKIYS